MNDKKFVKCKFCNKKLNRPLVNPKEDFTFVDHCETCKRYLCITLHPDGSVDMFECKSDYEPKHTKSLQQ